MELLTFNKLVRYHTRSSVGISKDLSAIEKGVIDNHKLRPKIIKEVKSGCVSLDYSQTFNFNNKFVLSNADCLEGHCSMCLISSSGLLHI